MNNLIFESTLHEYDTYSLTKLIHVSLYQLSHATNTDAILFSSFIKK